MASCSSAIAGAFGRQCRIEDQNGRYIAYVADSPGSATNPLTGQIEQNGTSLIDVTKPAKPVFVHHIPSIFPARQWPSSAKNSSMRSSNCTAFAISASGIGLLASDPGCKLAVSRAVPTRTALEFARDFRGAERANLQGDRKFESGFLQRRVTCEPDVLSVRTLGFPKPSHAKFSIHAEARRGGGLGSLTAARLRSATSPSLSARDYSARDLARLVTVIPRSTY